MPTVQKYVDQDGLRRFKNDYDTVIASAITTATSGKMSKIANATGGKIATTNASGEVAESGTAIADLATNDYVGTIPQSASATSVVEYVDEAIDEATATLAGVFHFKGTVATVSALPASGNTEGDVYHVTEDDSEHVWIEPSGGTGYWEPLGGAMDLSAYSTTTQMNAAIAAGDAAVVGQSGDAASANTVYGAKAYADSLGSNYATAAQGTLASTALQPGDIAALTDAEIDAIFQSA